jgi:predicted nucleic acid-binding protein
MPEVLLDSDILIDHLRGYEPARQYLKRFEAGEMQGYLSIITVAELAAGQMRQAQEEEKFIDCWRCSRPLPSILRWPGAGVRFDGNITPAWRMP